MWKDFMKKMQNSFNADDENEPFDDRDYASRTKELYKMLSEGNPDLKDYSDRAVYDIVNQIFHELEKRYVTEQQILYGEDTE